MQTRMQSFVESLVNIAIGMCVSWASNFLIFPAVGLPIPPVHTLAVMTFYFTIVSIARSYLIRRYFNGGFHLRRDT